MARSLNTEETRLIAEVNNEIGQASERALEKILECGTIVASAFEDLGHLAGPGGTLDTAAKPLNDAILNAQSRGTNTTNRQDFNTQMNSGEQRYTQIWQWRDAAAKYNPWHDAAPAATSENTILGFDVEQLKEFIENPAGEAGGGRERDMGAMNLTSLDIVRKARQLQRTETPYQHSTAEDRLLGGNLKTTVTLTEHPLTGIKTAIERLKAGILEEDYPSNPWIEDSIVRPAFEAFVAAAPELLRLWEMIDHQTACIQEAAAEFYGKQAAAVEKLVKGLGGVKPGCVEADPVARMYGEGTTYAIGAAVAPWVAMILTGDDLEATSGGCAGLHAVEFPHLNEDALAKALGALKNARRPIAIQYSENKERMLFQEQCYLLSYVGQLSAWKQENLDSAAAPQPGFPLKRLPYKTTETNPDKREANASLLVDGDPYGFLNKLTLDHKMGPLFDISNSELSHLQPMIRLFKVNRAEDGTESQQEIKFESNAGSLWPALLTEALGTKEKRGFGVGLKDFSFTYDGSNPFAIKKSIKGRLKIFANSFDELLVDRGGWKYADLALKTGGPAKEGCTDLRSRLNLSVKENEENSKLNFRLKAVVGWAEPKGGTSVSLAVKDALYNSFVTLNLTPTVHEFDLDEMGRVNFVINYLAYIEDYFDQRGFNIFSDSDKTEEQIRRKLQIENYQRNCSEDAIEQLKKEHIDAIAAEKSEMLQSLIKSLMNPDDNKIYYLNLPYTEIQQFQSQGPLHTPSNSNLTPLTDSQANERLESAVEDALEGLSFAERAAAAVPGSTFAGSLFVDNPDNYSLGFFYISDLIDTILYNIGKELEDLPGKIADLANERVGGNQVFDACDLLIEKEKLLNQQEAFKKLRILLGPVEFVDQANKSRAFFVNFGDVPIAVKYFIEWLTERMLQKEESSYSLTKFLNDLFNHLIKEFLNNKSCFKVKINQKVMVNQSVLTSYPQAPGEDEITAAMRIKSESAANTDFKRAQLWWWEWGTESPFQGSILNISGDREFPGGGGSVEEEINYFVYFAGRTAPTDLMTGNKFIDEGAGIFHYLLGRDRGLIKNIKLIKTDSKGLAEVRYEQDGWGGLDQLRVQYDAQIDCFANPKTFPGCYIYVDPKGFAPATSVDPENPFNLTNFGIGGYYMIYKSEHLFGAGQANTRIYAKWVAELHTEQDQNRERPREGEDSDYTKCTNYAQTRRLNARAGMPQTPGTSTSTPPDNVSTPAPTPN